MLALLAVKFGWGVAGGVLVLIPLLANRQFHAGDVGVGLLMAGRGVGALIGPFVGRASLGPRGPPAVRGDRGRPRGVRASGTRCSGSRRGCCSRCRPSPRARRRRRAVDALVLRVAAHRARPDPGTDLRVRRHARHAHVRPVEPHDRLARRPRRRAHHGARDGRRRGVWASVWAILTTDVRRATMLEGCGPAPELELLA